MTQTGPWSVKGIDQRARDAAREAAGAEGMTLGEYLNKLLLTSDSEAPNEVTDPFLPPPAKADTASSALDRITRRIEATEARSTLAITGMDQTVLGLVARLENAEQGSASIASHVEGLIDELKSTHESLQAKVSNLEADDAAEQNLKALKSLEQALGKLASHVYEENELAQNETQAIKGRVEAGFSDVSDRVESMETRVEETLSSAAARVERAVEQAELRAEGTARHLSDRMNSLESHVATRLEGVGNASERLDSVESDVSGALQSMEGTLLRIQDRLNRAETTTDAALKSLESTFEHLDEKIEAVASSADPELAERLRAEFEARFEDLSASVRETVANARNDLADEITKAAASNADAEIVTALQNELANVQTRLEQSEVQQTSAIESVGNQVEQLSISVEEVSNSFETRFMEIAGRDDAAATEAIRSEIERISENVGEKIEDLAEQVDTRINDSEQRSAEAIGQIGNQVASVASRIQSRQEEGLRLLHKELDETRKRSDARLTDALSSVSDRLELMQSQATASLSPVQKAIASLATRLEGVEEFNAPPYAGAKANIELPEFPEHPQTPPLFTPADAESGFAQKAPISVEQADDAVSFEPTFEEITDDISTGLADDIANEIIGNVSSDISAEFSDAMAAGVSPGKEKAEKKTSEVEFEAGIDGWEVNPEPESPYADDFQAIAEAAAKINLDGPAQQEYVADVPGDADGEDMMDPLAAFEAEDYGASEARESDIFDDEPTQPTIQPENTPFEDLAFDLDTGPQEIDAETSDYIARARRAAIAAADTGSTNSSTVRSKSKRKKGGGGGGGGGGKSSSSGSKKVPLLAAASVIAIGGTAAGLYVLRGKQAAPVQTVAIDTYQDPGAAAPDTTEIAETETTVADINDEIDTALDAADTPSSELTESDSYDLFDAETETAAVADTAPQVVSAAAATYPLIPAPVSVESAANSGNRVAQYQLGQAKIDAGELQEGANLIRKSANKDLPIAQYRLAKLHEKGIGVPKDLKLARDWTEKSARGGNIKAMHDLAVFMAEGEGGEQSYAGAVEWFRRAAEFDIVDSQYNLGVLYEQGLGISADPKEALFWFQIAARNGDSGAPSKVRQLQSALSAKDSSAVLARSSAWQPGRTNAIANGRFGVQSWNTGNPLQAKGVQTALNAMGYDIGEPDGVIGINSENAIREYQTKNGLDATGKVDATLIEHLNANVSSGAAGSL